MNKILSCICVVLLLIVLNVNGEEENVLETSEEKTDNQHNVVLVNDNEVFTNDLTSYLIGVVAAEMPASFEIEALKAQAIAARTYVLAYQSNNDVIQTNTNAQVYISEEEMHEKWLEQYDLYYNKISSAVSSTEGLILTYEGKPIKAYYYSMSNGYTESSLNVFNEQTDYLNIVESKWDKDNENISYLSKNDFCQKLSIDCSNIIIENIVKDNSNRVSQITINNQEFTGINIRKLLGLRSTDFEFSLESEKVKITTHGYGHGVGMSQYGANYMAKEGYTYKEILLHYYQNVEISKM